MGYIVPGHPLHYIQTLGSLQSCSSGTERRKEWFNENEYKEKNMKKINN